MNKLIRVSITTIALATMTSTALAQTDIPLDCLLEPAGPITKPDLERLMIAHVLAKAELVGTYRRFDQPG